ncbi:MAG: prepilin-type N-terminal cleavage/methylation domain-containing protein [Candidatus Nitronauta litoralis]|uniref:Prepilin-type N-terminal cleavage/methylation domain-containing protein n=1 Tax=Candidatus Nitronauta litoralis TaxID=2705533 RepID=A0A7T0G109_9BACT|nr:MAG: prepilin-type N-terminal cleavage/methylation domain-containing protein [Candidatus Nitronauta litoralis]
MNNNSIRFDQSGFTLLELLLVVTLLSTTAFMTLSAVENNSDQIRFEDTRNRLSLFRTAILGSNNLAPAPGDPLTGYVVDNGVLPGNIDALVNLPANFDPYILMDPIFDPNPDSNGWNNGPALPAVGGEIPLSNPAQQLLKGHRNFYLQGASNGFYRDGWGTTGVGGGGGGGVDCPTDPLPVGGGEGNLNDALNHGWCVTTQLATVGPFTGQPNNFFADSAGRDSVAGALTGDFYEQDIVMQEPVQQTDWQTTIQALTTVTIVNASGVDINLSDATSPPVLNTNLRAALLFYRNDFNAGTSGQWRRVSTDISLAGCLDGTGDGLCNGNAAAPAPPKTTAAFPANVQGVPAGEHLLVLVDDVDGTINTNDDTTTLTAGIGTAGFVNGTRVRFYPRGGTPTLQLTIR